MLPSTYHDTKKRYQYLQEIEIYPTTRVLPKFFEIQVEDFSQLVVSIQQHRQITRQMSQLRSCPPRSTVNIWRRSPLLFSHIFTSFSFAMLKGKLVLDVPKFHVKKHGILWTIQVSHHQTSPAPKGTRTSSEQWQACRGWRFLLPAKSLRFPSRIYLCKRILQRMKMDTSKWFTWLNDVHLRSSDFLCLNS